MTILNVANIVTFVRLVMIVPLFFFTLTPRYYLIALVLFGLAMLTDVIDGFIARRFNMITNLGKFMDQITDKLLINAILLIFLWNRLLPLWFVTLVILRDIVVGGVRMFLASKEIVVPANIWGKMKTLLQTFLISLIYIIHAFSMENFVDIVNVIMYITAVVVVFSGYTYFRQAMPYFLETEEKNEHFE